MKPPRKSWGTYFHVKSKTKWGPSSSFLAPTRSSRKANLRPFVRSVQTCLELSIFIILAQTSMLTSKVSLSSLSGLSQLSLSSLLALS